MLSRLGKDIAVYGIGDFVFKFIAFAVFPIYAHVFSVEDFGIMALATVTAGLVGIVSNVGLNNAVQRYYWDPSTKEKDQASLVSTGLFLSVACSLMVVTVLVAALYSAHPVIYERYRIPAIILALALLSVVPDQLLQYSLDVIRLHLAPWRYALVSFLKNVLGVALGLVLILLFQMGVVGVFWGALIASALVVPLVLFLIRKDLRLQFSGKIARELIRFGYPFVFAGMAYWIFGSMDRWMLVEFSDNTQVGLYSIAFKFGTIVLFLNTAFGQAWSPMAIKIRRDDANYRKVYSELLSGWFFILVITGATVTFFGQDLLHVLTPREYWSAATVLGALVMGVVLSGTTQITALGISLERKTRLLATAAWITAAVNFVLNWALIPRWGALGAATATLGSYAVLTGLFLFWTQRLHPIPLEKAKLLYCVALVVGVAGASVGLGAVEVSVPLALGKAAALALMLAGGIVIGIVDPVAIRGAVAQRLKA